VTQHQEHPVSITSARTSHTDDLHKRQVRYLLSMGIRTVCFVLAIVTSGPVRWVLVAAAVFLPYVAVVLANATDRRHSPGPASFLKDDVPTIEGKPVDDEPRQERP
jgi:Flp pilus assembly protein TadB